MSRTRRTFGKDFKAKVVLEALKEKDTIEVLAKSTSCCPIKFQCGSPKRYGIFLQFFCRKTVVAKMKFQQRNSTLESVS
jgi:hypothetical protein